MKFVKPNKATVARTIFLAITLINTLFYMLGKSVLEIDEAMINGTVEAMYTAVTAVTLLTAPVIAWWKNNSFTRSAQAGDMVKDQVKAQLENEKLDAEDFEGVI